jgi:hypothetical protein
MVERHALVRAFARAHFSSASEAGKVPNAIVLPAHCELWFSKNGNCERKGKKFQSTQTQPREAILYASKIRSLIDRSDTFSINDSFRMENKTKKEAFIIIESCRLRHEIRSQLKNQ